MKNLLQKFTLLIVTLTIFSTAQIFGQLDDNREKFCREGFFSRESNTYKIAKIKGQKNEKVYFFSAEREDCPQNKNCRLKSYLIPNDEVIVSRSLGNFACAWFQPGKGNETVGWLPLENLEYQPDTKIALNDWLGFWEYETSDIEIMSGKTPDALSVKGYSFWKGVGEGNVNIGEIEETVVPRENVLKIGEKDEGEYDCRATLHRLGRFLIVGDNLNCGGLNVSFSGVYQRKTTK